MGRMVGIACAVVVVLMLGACPPSEQPSTQPSAAAAWTEAAAYSFTLESPCGERDLIGRFVIEVEDGAVVAVEGLDDPGRRAASTLRPIDLPTLADLLALAADARNHGADQVHLVTDAEDGHPVSLEIDWEARSIDDEECYTVSDVVIGP